MQAKAQVSVFTVTLCLHLCLYLSSRSRCAARFLLTLITCACTCVAVSLDAFLLCLRCGFVARFHLMHIFCACTFACVARFRLTQISCTCAWVAPENQALAMNCKRTLEERRKECAAWHLGIAWTASSESMCLALHGSAHIERLTGCLLTKCTTNLEFGSVLVQRKNVVKAKGGDRIWIELIGMRQPEGGVGKCYFMSALQSSYYFYYLDTK